MDEASTASRALLVRILCRSDRRRGRRWLGSWEDCVVGANESFGTFFDAGLCHVLSGRTGEILRALPEDENFGFDACGLGDVNGDGVPDFAVGAERQRGWTPDYSSEPAVQVRSGKDASILWMRRHVDLRR